jgi:hypothetical protein
VDDERWERGMPVLDRQARETLDAPSVGAAPSNAGAATSPVRRPLPGELPPSLRGLPPRSVPETRPTPLQRWYVLLSVVPLVCGAIAISALELGASLHDLLVRMCVVVGAPILFVVNCDATLRIWRSAWAWMAVDRARGLFRLAWVAAAVILLGALTIATAIVLFS